MRIWIMLGVATSLFLFFMHQDAQVTKLRRSVADLTISNLTLTEQLEGEREAYRQAIQLAILVKDRERQLDEMSNRLTAAIKNLGEDHAKKDPCFYQKPDDSTLDAIRRIDGLR